MATGTAMAMAMAMPMTKQMTIAMVVDAIAMVMAMTMTTTMTMRILLFARRLIYILKHMLQACMHWPLTHAWTPHSCMGADAAGVSAICFNPVL